MKKDKISWKRVLTDSENQTEKERLMHYRIVLGILLILIAISIIFAPIDKYILNNISPQITGKNYDLYSNIIKIIAIAMLYYFSSFRSNALSHTLKEIMRDKVPKQKTTATVLDLLRTQYPRMSKFLSFKNLVIILFLLVIILIILSIYL